MSQHAVFVYGTLLSGMGNYSRFLSPKKPVQADAYIYGELYHLGGFPGATKVGVAKRLIKGEIYVVDDKELQSLDMLEGYHGTEDMHSNLYNRVSVRSMDKYGNLHGGEVLVYEYNSTLSPENNGRPLIKSGDWRNQQGPDLLHFQDEPYEEIEDEDEIDDDF